MSEQFEENAVGEELLPFGPNALIQEPVWKRILRDSRAYAKSPPREINFALGGSWRNDVFIIKDSIMLVRRSDSCSVEYSVADLKKIEDEYSKSGMTVGGLLHTHPVSGRGKASEQDVVTWVSDILQFEHPLYFFILVPEKRLVTCYTIPYKTWMTVRNCFKPVEVTLDIDK